MSNDESLQGAQPRLEFEDLAVGKRRGLWREVGAFLIDTKKFWLIPIILLLALFGALVVLAASGAAPFVYTLF